MSEHKPINQKLFNEIKTIVAQSKQQIAVSVNATMSMMYWQVGKSINNHILNNKRAAYGKQIVKSLSLELVQEYGSSFAEKNMRRMMQFATVFHEEEIVATLWRQLSWSHIKMLIPIEDPLKRAFYIEMCKLEK